MSSRGESGDRSSSAVSSDNSYEMVEEIEVDSLSSSSRGVRRYFCDFCGVSRSKRSLIMSHMISHHQDQPELWRYLGDGGSEEKCSEYKCTECSASFRKPAYLRQHMQSHSLERPFVCPIEGCHNSYRRKDHLVRHLQHHEKKIFECSVNLCGRRFASEENLQGHTKKYHHDENDVDDVDDCSSSDAQTETIKRHICSEPDCGKSFKYPSQLKKHMNSHVKLDYVDVICMETGCMQHFSSVECLNAHVRTCHRYVQCSTCGSQQLRKNFKRHVRIHDKESSGEKIKCPYPRCLHTFVTKSNLVKHIKAVHLELRPFMCRFPGCGQRFPYKHVRDNHEKSGLHSYAEGDFLAVDEQILSRPRGGKKRKVLPVGSLLRKRIAAAPGDINSKEDESP
ncbi:transcription factor IIIA [Wolffia australiana]